MRPSCTLAQRLSARIVHGCVLLGVIVFCVMAPDARGARAALPGLPNLGTGITDDPSFRDSPARSRWMSRAAAIGSTEVRVGVAWMLIAPNHPRPGFRAQNPGDPQYDFTRVDAAVRAAAAHHQQVMLLIFDAPRWAEGPGMPAASGVGLGSWYPNPRDLGAFARAVALRYSGHFRDPLDSHRSLPRARDFQAWNEPNLSGYLSPQYGLTSSGAYVDLSPIIYRGLLNAVYAAVKKVAPQDRVFAAGTAPFGDGPGQHTGRMSPVVFLRDLFCLTPSLRRASCPGPPAHFDGLDHHIYSPPLFHAALPTDIGIPDLDRVWSLLHAAQRAHTVLPAGPKQLWVTEFGWSAFPVNSADLAAQAHNVELDLYEFWSEHVSRAFWFSIQDPIVQPGDIAANGGLYFMNGIAKPAAAAYHFPFVAIPAHAHALTLWGKAPRAGTVVIERNTGRRWKKVLRLRTTLGGIFYSRLHIPGTPELRATLGGAVSLAWTAGY